MYLPPVERSLGPSSEPTRLPADAVTESRFLFVKASRPSRTSSDLVERRWRASSPSASSRSAGSLNETVRMGVAMYYSNARSVLRARVYVNGRAAVAGGGRGSPCLATPRAPPSPPIQH